MTPDVTLKYNSQYTDTSSFVGLGWQLSIPYIVRKNTHGADQLYSRSDFTSSLDGDLILSQTVGSIQTYVPQSQTPDFPTYTLNTSTNTWQLATKTGTILTFGDSAATRQDDPGNSADIFKWMLSTSIDTNGNSITYSYTKNSGQIYPSSIAYTGNGSSSGVYSIGFSLAAVSTSAQISYNSGFSVQTNSVISQITTNFNGSSIRTYTLSYSTDPRSVKPVLTSIGLSATNSSGTVNPPATSFTYAGGSTGWGSKSTSWALPSDPTMLSNCGAGFQTYFSDVNGDGLTDVIYACAGSASDVFLNNGSGFTKSTTWTLPVDSTFAANCGGWNYVSYYFTDLNGDGLPDYVLGCFGYSNDVFLNTGSGWASTKSTTWALPINSSMTSNCGIYFQTSFADVNGDGLSDLIYGCIGQVSAVYLNNGNGWTLSSAWTLPIDNSFAGQCGNINYISYAFTDLNGDGLPDYVLTCKGYLSDVYLNMSSGWASTKSTTWALPSDTSLTSACGIPYNIYFSDVNGDGLTDLVYACAGFNSDVFINNGSGWIKNSSWTLPYDSTFAGNCGSWQYVQYAFADLNGDNVPDYVLTCPGLADVYMNYGSTYPKITSITLPNGGTVGVTYQSSPIYRDSSNNELNPNLPFAVQTVSSITTTDTVSSVSGTTNYTYAGGTYFVNSSNVFDRKFAGFQKVTATDPAGNVTISYYHTGVGTDSSHGEFSDDEYKIGKTYRVEQYDNSNHLFAKTINKWNDSSIVTGADLVKLDQTVDSSYDGQSTHKDKAVAYTYDNSTGNVTQQVEYGQVSGNDDGTFSDSGTDDFTTAYSYAANSTAHIYLPSDVTVTDHSSSKVKEDRLYYDAQALGTVNVGNQTKHESWVSGSTYINTQKTYDGTYGLVVSSTDARGKVTNFTLDSNHLYPATVTDPLSHATSFTYDYASGQVTQKTDPNSRVFQWTYDGLGRILTVKQPDLTTPSTLVNKTTYTYTDTSGSVTVQQADSLDGSTTVNSYTYFDGLGRKLQTRKQAESSYETVDLAYNNLGELSKQSLPYASSGSSKTSPTSTTSLYINYSYDPLQRVTTTTDAAGTITNSYNNWKLTVTDKNGKNKDLYSDAYGNLIQVDEHNSGSTYSTYYTYNYLGNLLSITDALSNIRNFTYNGLGQRLTAQDLHATGDSTFGSYSYTYDNNSNLTQKVDPNGNTINYTYDDINRELTEKLGSTTKVTNVYDSGTDGIGQLTSVTTPSYSQTLTYNPLGGLKSETKTISSTGYTTAYTYDRQGNQLTMTNPDSSIVKYEYDSGGLLEKVSTKEASAGSFTYIVSNFDYSPMEQPTTVAYTNGMNTTNTYDATKLYRLTSKVTTIASSSQAQNLAYTYDNNGNITQIIDGSATDSSKTANYTYDDLNRLTQAAITSVATGQTAYTENYTYNAIGNLLTKTGQGSYTYAGNTGSSYANPSAVTSIGSIALTYDNNGNELTNGSALTNTWDYNNRLTQVVAGSITDTYTYDAGGQRLTSANGTTTQTYPTKFYNTDGTTAVKHIFANGIEIGTVTGTGSGAAIHSAATDNLTGSSITSNSSDVREELLNYFPFGTVRLDEKAGSYADQKEFASMEFSADNLLNYDNARYYNAAQGQFLSEDPQFLSAGFNLSDPQSFNAYAYARNNPIINIDPTGQDFWSTANRYNPLIALFGSATNEYVNGLATANFKQIFNGATDITTNYVLVAALPLELVAGDPEAVDKYQSEISRGQTEATPVLGDSVPTKTYQTYEKVNNDTGEVYVGRTSGAKSPETNVINRDYNHHMSDKGFGAAQLKYSTDDYNAVRGQEQIQIDSYKEQGKSGNSINGISPSNPNRQKYLNAAASSSNSNQ